MTFAPPLPLAGEGWVGVYPRVIGWREPRPAAIRSGIFIRENPLVVTFRQQPF